MAGEDGAAMPPGVPRLDAEEMLARLARSGIELELIGAAPGGEVGAAFVRWPDGHDGVLTRAGDGSAASEASLRRTAEVLDAARAAGVPAPRYELIAGLGDAHAVVQERLDGAVPETVGPTLVRAMLDECERWAGLLADRPEIEPTSLYLTESGPGFCVHSSLERYDRRTRDLLSRVREIGLEVDLLEGEDLAHLDYHPGNVLVDEGGALTGVIDWDGWARGDRWFSVEVLGFDLARRRSDPAIREQVDALLESAVPPERLRAYRAHLALRQVDWSIRHHGPAEVDDWIAISLGRLDAVA